MDTSLVASIITAAAALSGVALTSAIQLRSLRRNQDFQIAHEQIKRENDLDEKEKTEALERLERAHRQLSVISREFSLTSLDINWRAEMTDSEYDQRYLALCERMDELRAIAGLFEPSLTEEVEKVHGQMNIFWGNFKNVLYLTGKGEKVTHTTPCFEKTHEAAREIAGKIHSLKRSLAGLATAYR